MTSLSVRADGILPCERLRLKNGLQVLLHEDHRNPFIAVDVTYHVGPLHEAPDSRGMSHLLSHLLELTSEHTGRAGPSGYLKHSGGAEVRTVLLPDRTSFRSVVARANLASALWVESDRMGFLLPVLHSALVTAVRGLISREIQLKQENAPYVLAEARLQQALLPSTPEGWSRSMAVADSESELHRFFRRFYAPSNATLAIVGDFDRNEAMALIEKYFSTLSSSSKSSLSTAARLAAPVAETVFKIEEPIAQKFRVQLTWVLPIAKQPDAAVADLVALLLDRGNSGALGKKLLRAGGPAIAVSVHQEALREQSLFTIYAYADKEAALPQIRGEIDEVLRELSTTPVPDEALAAVKLHYRNRLLLSLHGLLEKAELLQRLNHLDESANGGERALQLHQAVSAADLARFVQGLLQPSRRFVIYSNPGGGR